jgi:hypothetical protein
VSVDYWWIGLFVDQRMHARLEPHFAAAVAKSSLSDEAERAIAAWREHPSDYEESSPLSKAERGNKVNAFLKTFNLSGFVALARQLLTQDGALADLMSGPGIFRMATIARHPPVSIVWHALGFERAKELPGQMGNMLLHPAQVEAALEATRRAYAGPSSDDLFAAAKRYCGASVDDWPLRGALSFQPEGLEAALERDEGFFALTCPRI